MPKQDDSNDIDAISDIASLSNADPADIAEFLRAFKDIPESSKTSKPARGKQQVMKVFLDADKNYSVKGYRDRAAECFGEFYLCLDKGQEYERQSTKVNKAIQNITGAEAFGLALEQTRAVLAAGDAAGDLIVSAKVVTGLCRHWFDLPDGVHVLEVISLPRLQAVPPPQCPGDFIYPSGYLFFPDPGEDLKRRGPAFGRILKPAVLRFVTDLRMSNQHPKGVISRAIFDAFPSAEDELVAQTIIGVMVGMLPPVIINLSFTLSAWKRNEGAEFAKLKNALKQHGGSDPYERASQVLKQPLMQAMQKNPMPKAVWRTAEREDTLGAVQVNPGDKIDVQIISATQEDLPKHVTDVFPVFGGDRSATPHPTHACPAYEMALGIMLGVINGLMEPA